MSITDIQITAAGVIESTLIYGIVHSIWTVIKWGLRHLQTDAGRIIESHVSEEHKAKFERCVEGACARFDIAKPRTGLEPLHQAEQ